MKEHCANTITLKITRRVFKPQKGVFDMAADDV